MYISKSDSIHPYSNQNNSIIFMLIDDRDGNGFWENFTVSSIYGKFVCAEENCTREWKSKQIQVDMKVSYIHCINYIIF